MDVISLGLVIPQYGFSEDPIGVAASRMARNGTVVVMASAYNPQ